MDLRPGVGSARLEVPPSMGTYEASPAGQWPNDLSSDRWTGNCKGLNARGTPFVLRKGEWERLKGGDELQLGSEIRIVADVRNAPPPACSVEVQAIKPHNKLEWRAWRVFLPDSVSTALDRWAEAINVTFASRAGEIALLGVPQGFDSNGPVFTTGHSFIAKIKWAAGEPSAALSLGTPLGSESTSTWSTQESPTYMAFGIQDSGTTTLTANYDRRTTEIVETAVASTLGEIRNKLRATPRFEIVIGDTTVPPWRIPSPCAQLWDKLLLLRSRSSPATKHSSSMCSGLRKTALGMLTASPQQRFKKAWPPRGARTPILKSLPEHSVAFVYAFCGRRGFATQSPLVVQCVGRFALEYCPKPIPALGCVAVLRRRASRYGTRPGMAPGDGFL